MRIAYAAAVLAAGFLVFVVQPIAGRQILPAFGGAPAVWATSLVFFQSMLLAGYCYAHLSVRYLGARAQAAVHVVLLLGAAGFPVGIDAAWSPDAGAAPSAQILWSLAHTVGVPFLALAATAPLLQAWYARGWPERSPYRLYAASNAGAFVALIAYPFVIEPYLRVSSQVLAWRGCFGIAALVSAACAVHAARLRGATTRSPQAAPSETEGAARAAPSRATRALWLALPFAATTLLLAVTNALSLDLAPVPFLWIAPLGVYLLTYVLAFSSEAVYSRAFYLGALALAVGAVVGVRSMGAEASVVVSVGAYLFALFAAAMVCHGELAALRPVPRHLTRYFVAIGVGGALGGTFVGLAAPLVFADYRELPLGLLLCGALALAARVEGARARALGASAGSRRVQGIVAVGLLALGLAAAGFMATASPEAGVIHRERGFFGVLRVVERELPGGSERLVSLVSGTTPHGAQVQSAERRAEATTYYGASSGVGRVLRASAGSPAPLRVGAVGLGVGTLASYGRAGDAYRFYELNPRVLAIAAEYFTFLRDSAATTAVELGDARISLEREAPNAFDVLVLDAFTSDAIPVHLLTVEAFAIYLTHLAEDGVIAAHISNRHLDLRPVVAGAAARFGLHAVIVRDEGDGVTTAGSTWALLARTPERLALREVTSAPGFSPLDPARTQVWTDDYAPLLPVVRFGLAGFD